MLKSFSKSLDKLSADFGQIKAKQESTDVVFHSLGEKIPAHSAILDERCPYLLRGVKRASRKWKKRSHQKPYVVKSLGSAEVEGLLHHLLTYVYTGKVSGIHLVAHRLLAVAREDCCDLPELRSICGKALCENVVPQNCVPMLIIAHENNCRDLRIKAMDVVVGNMASVVETDEFARLYDCGELFKEVIRKLVGVTDARDASAY
ncbi:TD and POZ domain-containing protein 1-like [Copidosoma floridanum]|uniref:TD and POZ domain-containing protein 1-like n=1 Tax=Copidosoma floridanum TaxID=29053 RepID=UPI0006C9E06C|nr:TD and POZ domain-containing protein 1-like [Copidosoma floridanum]